MAVKQIDPHSSKKLHLSFDMDVVDLPTSQVLRLYVSTPLRDLPLRPSRIGSDCARYPRWFADVGADKSHQGRRHTRIFRDCFAGLKLSVCREGSHIARCTTLPSPWPKLAAYLR
jgi:hypothetical protein